jgi:hypothetical protein
MRPRHQNKISLLSTLFQNHKNMERPPKKPKHNATTKSIDTGIESVPQVNVKNTTNSADAGNVNMVVASGGIDAVVESETHDGGVDNPFDDSNELVAVCVEAAEPTEVVGDKGGAFLMEAKQK